VALVRPAAALAARISTTTQLLANATPKALPEFQSKEKKLEDD
jgi:hypothetical protein